MLDKPAANTIRAIFALYREFEQASRRADISMAQYRMLLYLRNGPKRAGAIAAAYEVTRPTVSLSLSALRERGWIKNVLDPVSSRFVAVAITAEGARKMEAFETALSALLEGLVDADTLDQIRDVLSSAYVKLGETKETRLRTVEAEFARDDRTPAA